MALRSAHGDQIRVARVQRPGLAQNLVNGCHNINLPLRWWTAGNSVTRCGQNSRLRRVNLRHMTTVIHGCHILPTGKRLRHHPTRCHIHVHTFRDTPVGAEKLHRRLGEHVTPPHHRRVPHPHRGRKIRHPRYLAVFFATLFGCGTNCLPAWVS